MRAPLASLALLLALLSCAQAGAAPKQSPWLADFKILVLADADVDPELPGVVSKALRLQAAALGSKRLTVEPPQTAPEALSSCAREGVVKISCVARALASLRQEEPYAGAILYYLTNAAIDRLPKDLGGGRSSGPPAGQASYSEGWMMQSFYYRELHLKEDPTLRAFGGLDFSRHSIAHTARHELGHILGLAHHKAPAGRPRPKCLMVCGSGDDAWRHLQASGEDFGLCPRCRAAASIRLVDLEAP